MRRNPFSFLLLSAVVLSPLSASLDCQGMTIPTERLQSPIDSTRVNAFEALQAAADDHRKHPDRPWTSFLADSARAQPALAAALIQLLVRENGRVASAAPGSLSVDYLDGYYTTLQVTVARIHDPTSASALLPGIARSGVIINALASFGDIALNEVLAALHSTNSHDRFAAVQTLSGMIERRTQNHLSSVATERIVQTFLSEIVDRASPAREQAIHGLLPLSNPEIRPVMILLASSDTTASLNTPGAPVRYGVRDAARAWLAAHPN
jgi:hypothetical protein